MNKFQKISLLGGWAVFLVALIVYTLTLEPVNGLWDCSEFIATSYKLEVGHPPGTPFFFLINRLGAMFAGDPANVSYAINFMSGLESALTIGFMFWSIVMLGRMMYKRASQTLTDSQQWSVIIGAAIGSLGYAFTDTFWFSAVEAEVYALSSLFTAVVFWAILKWETKADQPGSNRWLILIAYLMGLSIGAHILNLLAIPALVFVYYFKKFPGRKKMDMWKPGVVAILLTGVFYILTPTVVSIGAFVDRIFVNSFGLGVNSGLTLFVALVLGVFIYMAWWSQKRGRAMLNTIFMSSAMVVIGFSSYGIVLIRSSANPPMNSNHPDNPYALLSFLNRDQYGSQPLMFGQTYNSPVVDYVYNETYVINDEGKYVPERRLKGHKYDPKTEVFFPRMYSSSAAHKKEYEKWSDVKGRKIRSDFSEELITVPTFGDNLTYFFTYQLNHMYWRYFMWNFVGRQSDLQSYGNIDDGMWMSGVPFIDESFLGPQDDLPREIGRNKGRNVYFFLPFILAMIGFFFHLNRDGKGFMVILLLFFMTGLAIILYLNQTPLQPRERDYAYAGSFYAFAMWIGFGAMWLCDWLNKKMKGKSVAALTVGAIVSLSVPIVLAQQNWDDHDRSGRTIARDAGFNYLNSTLPNSILVNYGDNDTFPIWYAQEVEGLRTDVRPMNQQYIGGDWYIEQMKIKSNDSEPVPFSLKKSKYSEGAPMQFPIRDIAHPAGGTWTAKEVMDIVNSDEKWTKMQTRDGTSFDFIPNHTIAIPVNKENAIASGIVKAQDAHLMVDTIFLKLSGDVLGVDQMLMVDLFANFDWKRPLYFTSFSEIMKLGLVGQEGNKIFSYLQNDGALYRLVPIKTKQGGYSSFGRIDKDLLYDNLMNKYGYGNAKDENVYVCGFFNNTIGSMHLRDSFNQLAESYIESGDSAKAVEVLDRSFVEMPLNQFKVDESVLNAVELYWKAGAQEKGDELADYYGDVITEYINYYNRFTGRKADLVKDITYEHIKKLYFLQVIAQENGRDEIASRYKPIFDELTK